MKKLLLTTLLLSGTFFIDIEARRAHQATQNNKIPAPQCAQVDINEERLKLTWDGWFWEHIGYPDQNRLAAQANIYKLLAEKALAQKAEIDRHNHVYQEWKNNVLTSIYGLKYPAIVAFLCFAYANSPKHDGTIPGQIYSGLAGTMKTTEIVAITMYDVVAYTATQIASAVSTAGTFASTSINDYLKHQYQPENIALIAPEVVTSVVGQPGYGIA